MKEGKTLYRAEVAGVGEATWSSNAKTYESRQEAQEWLDDLALRWTGYDASRIVEASTPRCEPVRTRDEFYQNWR